MSVGLLCLLVVTYPCGGVEGLLLSLYFVFVQALVLFLGFDFDLEFLLLLVGVPNIFDEWFFLELVVLFILSFDKNIAVGHHVQVLLDFSGHEYLLLTCSLIYHVLGDFDLVSQGVQVLERINRLLSANELVQSSQFPLIDGISAQVFAGLVPTINCELILKEVVIHSVLLVILFL